tara:strand:+ start:119446 stop:120741 length:1296 start_codon:yes stop_codon:yes gene_type:complete
MKNYITITLTAVLLILSPIVATAQLNCYSLKAPEKTIEGMQKLAIMNFENRKDVNWRYTSSVNDYGSQLADYMIAKLLEEHRGVYARGENYMERYKTNVYTVIERSELDKIMAEQSLGASGAVSDGDAADVGKLLGLDVIITGGYSTDVSSSAKTSSSKNSKTGKVTYTHSAVKKAVIEVTMKIISVETGQILSMTTKTKTQKSTASSSKSQSDARGKLPSDQTIISNGMKAISLDLVSYFTPVFVFQGLDVEKPKVKDYKADFKEAKKEVKENNLSAAFAIVKKVYDADPYDAAMAHNMGVLYEAVGNYDQALTYHNTAYELDDSKAHKKSVERALNSKEALEELGKLGVEITPYVFDASAGEKLNVEKVTTAGKKKDRIEVYTEPNKGADVAVKVPGDTEFEVLGKEGSWVKIKLLGGKEGWVNKSDLD